MDSDRLMVILITDSGHVDQSVVELPDTLDEAVVGELRARINEAVVGRSLDDTQTELKALPDTSSPDRRPIVELVVEGICRTLDAHRTDRLLVSGAANLVKTEGDFSESVYPVLEAIEEQVTVLKLFSEMSQDGPDIFARIGREMDAPLSETSVVAGSYSSSDDETGVVGVLGPIRMDYPGNMSAVRAVARYLTRLLDPQATQAEK